MVATRNQTAPEPLALFRALLHGNVSMARRLLAGSSADQLALVAPVGNVTVLHAAVVGRCSAVLPQLAAACAAADISVDALLEMEGGTLHCRWAAPVRHFLRSLGVEAPGRLHGMDDGATALSIAVWYQDLEAIQALLQAGADPSATTRLADVVRCMDTPHGGVSCSQLLGPLLQHGLDPLGTAGPWSHLPASILLVECWSKEAAALMLDHLEAQQASGTLQLGTKHRCQQLLLGASRSGTPRLQLVQSALTRLHQLTRLQAVHVSDAAALSPVLLAAAAAGRPAVLSALLASQLPWDLAAKEPHGGLGHPDQRGYSVLAAAAMSSQPAACVRLLNEAGAAPTASDLYCAIDALSPAGVAALLTCGVPPIDTSRPEAIAPVPVGWSSRPGWSCPIHRTLHVLCDSLRNAHSVPYGEACRPAVQILEGLHAAGVLPAVYANAQLPIFAWSSHDRLLPQLDPFDFYRLETSAARGLPSADRYTDAVLIPQWVLFVAQGGSWSPATHHHWPDGFKSAARSLLLAGSRGEGSLDISSTHASSLHSRQPARRRQRLSEIATAAVTGGQQKGCLLGTLPAELLLRIMEMAAEPLSAWL